MKSTSLFLKFFIIFLLFTLSVYSQTGKVQETDSTKNIVNDSLKNAFNDSLNTLLLNTYKQKLNELEQLQQKDSITRNELIRKLNTLNQNDNQSKEELQKKLYKLEVKDSTRIAQKRAQIESLKEFATGYPVLGPLNDTLFLVYNKIGSFSASERAQNITHRIKKLYHDEFLELDSIKLAEADNSVDIIYKDIVIMSITESDALWNSSTESDYELAETNTEKIKTSIESAMKEHSFSRTLIRIGLTILVFVGAFLVIWLINWLYKKTSSYLSKKRGRKIKDLKYKGYTFLSVKQSSMIILFFVKVIRWALIIVAVYLILPLVFSIFPITREWADALFGFIWSPLKKILLAIWHYMPNLFTIIIIFFVFKYIIRLTKYLFSEVGKGKLKLPGFYPDWATPTFHIVRIILMAFAFVMIFPYLPGSGSPVFAGVSVFLGLLVSLGSSSAIANMIAGLVITYMRPFKIGDRIKFGDKSGEVIEKTVLVTRLKTGKNEEVTIPNATILTGNTVNFSSFSQAEGLIIHTDLTVGYDIEWQEVHQALIESALRTKEILKDPKPFVLQLSLDDFYVTYQLNAYIREPGKQAAIYSSLHQNIQDVFNEKGFELLSPHYEANRDGNSIVMPKKYMPKDYKAPVGNVKLESSKENEQQ